MSSRLSSLVQFDAMECNDMQVMLQHYGVEAARNAIVSQINAGGMWNLRSNEYILTCF